MECQAESKLDPNIRYTWTKNGRPFIINGQDVFSESSLNGNILFISPKSSDVGTYQCEAMNDFGNAFSEASLLRAQTFKQPRRLNKFSQFSCSTINIKCLRSDGSLFSR